MKNIYLFKYYLFIKNILQSIKIKKKINFFKLKKNKNAHLVLVELYDFLPTFTFFLFFLFVFNQKYKLNYKFYFPQIQKKNKITLLIKKLPLFLLCGCLNYNKVIFPRATKTKRINNIYFKKLKQINSNKDFLNLKIENIEVGDLFYDEFLRSNKLVTIDIKDGNFKEFLSEAIYTFYFWYDYLKKKKVNSIISSHSTYFIGLPARIAINLNTKSYIVSPSSVTKLSKKYPTKFSISANYKKIFSALNPDLKKKYIKMAKKDLLLNFLNDSNVSIPKTKHKILNKKITYLIPLHSFNDAVHFHGKKLVFNDHFDWINFLGNLSNKSKNRWLLKLHPDLYNENKQFLIYILKKFKNFEILPDKFSLKKILKITDIVLTVYGTVGREYPLFNIPVINASYDNLHSKYKFNYHFNSFKKYKFFLENIENNKIKKIKIQEKDKIFEYFTARFYMDYCFVNNASYNLHLFSSKKKQKKNFNNYLDLLCKSLTGKQNLYLIDNIYNYLKSGSPKLVARNDKKYSKF